MRLCERCLADPYKFSAGDMSSNCTSAAPVSASKTKTKKKHFIGQKVKLFRASEPILSILMWGVNHTVSLVSNATVLFWFVDAAAVLISLAC